MFRKCILLSFCFTLSVTFANQSDTVNIGRFQNAGTVSLVRVEGGDWGIEISGDTIANMTQDKPAQIEIYRGPDDVQQIASGYQSVTKKNDLVVATAKIMDGDKTAFEIVDQWMVSGNVLSLSRKVNVTGTEDNAGFYSAIKLFTAPAIKWEDVNCLVPGLLYANSSYAGSRSPTSVSNYRAKRFEVREDYMSAPLFGVFLRDGTWSAVLDMSPKGDTTQAENSASAATPIIDERIQFGALGAKEITGGGIEMGFWLPGTTTETGSGFSRRGRRGAQTDASIINVRRRYHPVKEGFSQSYKVAFCFGKSDSFRDMQRNTWRWAWESLDPKIYPIDVDVVRRTLLDHLSDRVLTVEGRTGIPFEYDAVSGTPSDLVDKVIMGFCGKNLEGADQLLQEGDRDTSDRGQKMRKQGLAIIDTLIRIMSMSPPAGVGYNIQTGEPAPANFIPGFTTRMPAEDLAVLVNTYRREKASGRDHPEWIKWVNDYCDWLITQQNEDGSFPAAWESGTGQVIRDGKTTSYVLVPVLVRLSEVTAQKKYIDSPIKAAEYIWANFGSQGVYLGSTWTGNNIADKESGMLSMEAFLALYDNTNDPKWLERAKSAADYTESWIWIWNVPMPLDADDSRLHWKIGVPTIGVNGIGSDGPGGVDEYLDWAAPTYAKLYKYTKDEHYLDVARVLLHDTKSMLALPGRTYDLLGPGWQQEHWNMGPGRKGMGAHRNWLPWISINHLHSIMGLEELDKDLYKRLAKGD